MERSFWDRVQELRESINGGVEPMDEVRLPTGTVKFALGMFLFQSAVIALWWSIKDHVFYPWLLFISAFLQVGWFWSKVTDSWKRSRGYGYHPLHEEDDLEDGLQDPFHRQEPMVAPTINIQNVGVTGQSNRTVSVPLDVESARNSMIRTNESIEEFQTGSGMSGSERE